MKNKFLTAICIVMIVIAVPMAYITFLFTRVPHNIIPNQDNVPTAVPDVLFGRVHIETAGLMGAGLYLFSIFTGIAGIFNSRKSRNFLLIIIYALMLAGITADIFLLGNLFFLILPLAFTNIMSLWALMKK